MRASLDPGTAQTRKCGPTQTRELRKCTNTNIPSLGNYTNVRMRASSAPGTGHTCQCGPPRPRERANVRPHSNVGCVRAEGAGGRGTEGTWPGVRPTLKQARRCLAASMKTASCAAARPAPMGLSARCGPPRARPCGGRSSGWLARRSNATRPSGPRQCAAFPRALSRMPGKTARLVGHSMPTMSLWAELRKRTNAGLPRPGNCASVRMRDLPRPWNYANLQMRASGASGTAPLGSAGISLCTRRGEVSPWLRTCSATCCRWRSRSRPRASARGRR